MAGDPWPRGIEPSCPDLGVAEIRALVLAAPARLLADLGLRQASDAALLKLVAALPALARSDVDYARQRIRMDPSGWYEIEESLAALSTLQEAIWQECRLRLTYRRGDGATIERLVDPLGLVAKGRV